jgi:hypothetical protein
VAPVGRVVWIEPETCAAAGRAAAAAITDRSIVRREGKNFSFKRKLLMKNVWNGLCIQVMARRASKLVMPLKISKESGESDVRSRTIRYQTPESSAVV